MIPAPTTFALKPPLLLKRGCVVRTLDDAAEYARTDRIARDALRRDGVVHRLEGAHTADQMADAANAFRAWAEGEGLLTGFAE
jgi:hypothetical protein